MTQVKEPIPFTMWQSALMIALQSFLFGYFFSCLNSCLVTGDNNSGSDCYHGKDSSCPTGTIYNDINLSTSIYIFSPIKYFSLILSLSIS